MPSPDAPCVTSGRFAAAPRSRRARAVLEPRRGRSAGRPTRRRSTAAWPRSAVVFASIGRQPHVWTSPPHDEPADLVARLAANGFEDVGDGLLLVARDVEPGTLPRLSGRPLGPGMTLERLHAASSGCGAEPAAEAIVSVLLARSASARTDGPASSPRPGVAGRPALHPLPRAARRAPLAVARRATFDGDVLPVIDRHRGLRPRAGARPVRHRDGDGRCGGGGQRAGSTSGSSRTTSPARRLYEGLGFVMSGDPGPDMIFVG